MGQGISEVLTFAIGDDAGAQPMANGIPSLTD
jgi:hypothetical protein